MQKIILDLIGFFICAYVIFLCGSRLSRYGDQMADRLGWGKMFLGIILMASVTSMPELMTGISSVVMLDAPDLAVGDIVGSCAFNILIISMMDLFYHPAKPLTSSAQTGHILAAASGIILLSILTIAIMKPELFGHFKWIGLYTFIFILVYILSVRMVFRFEQKHRMHTEAPAAAGLTLRQIIIRYAVNALFVIAAALLLPYFGKHLAENTGLSQSFFGTLFLAASTSLPEVVVSLAAIRMGFIDLAIGNIFGSNLFNIIILAIDDILYTRGPLFNYTDPAHALTVLGTIVITAIGIAGIVFRPERKWKLALDTAAIAFVYTLIMFLLYRHS
jgi:cation:H+ antiporter